jgi:hypothetical protein
VQSNRTDAIVAVSGLLFFGLFYMYIFRPPPADDPIHKIRVEHMRKLAEEEARKTPKQRECEAYVESLRRRCESPGNRKVAEDLCRAVENPRRFCR